MTVRDRELAAIERKHRHLSRYYSNREVIRSAINERRAARKVAGLDCPEKCLADNERCRRCRDRHLESNRALYARRAERDAKIAASYRPVDEIIDLTRVRILRGARHLEWFTLGELFDLLGGGDDTRRNTTTQALARLAKAGQFERRRAVVGFGSGYGAQWEYQITAAGVAEMDRVLRSTRPAAMTRRSP